MTHDTTLQDSILAAADKPREKSLTHPAAAYTDPTFHAFENAEIFHKEWISLCHVSQVPNAGDFVRVDLCGEPLLLVRGKDMVVRVLSRICRHRGMDLMPSGYNHPDKGNKRVILCPYHLWSYDLGGKLVGAPEMTGAKSVGTSSAARSGRVLSSSPSWRTSHRWRRSMSACAMISSENGTWRTERSRGQRIGNANSTGRS